jgi:hypothetical protein
MKHVVSISLGTSQRDKKSVATILGEEFEISRVGVDGDLKRYRQMFIDLDGKVDALGVGGADIYVVIEEKRYIFRQIADLVSGAKKTPVVDGSGLKHTLERETIRTLAREGVVDFKNHHTLLVSAADRFGMAQALVEQGGAVTFGDINFGLGVNYPLTTYAQVKKLGNLLLPLITQLPFKWVYPTGDKQLQRTPKFPKLWAQADIIAGDWHYIRRYAPDNLAGKIVVTNTLRTADIELLRSWKVAKAITTTPLIGGETFATNVMEGVVVTLLGKRPEQLNEADYLDVLKRLDWTPQVIDLGKSESTL